MDRRNNQFLEPERSPNLVAWAVKQLAWWLGGGLVVYALVANHLLFQSSAPKAPPQPAAAEPAERLARAALPATNSLTLRAQRDGYAYVKASVNGSEMTMAFDTGASYVSLTQADAVKAGVAGNLSYTHALWTANGNIFGAPVVLREVRIGQLVIEDVQALVMQNMRYSLLGQTFLNRLSSYEMRNGMLTLTWQ